MFQDRSIAVWDMQSPTEINLRRVLVGHRAAVNVVDFVFQDRSIAVWDMQSPTEINLRRVLVGHRAAVNVVDFDEKYIVSASGDRTIKVRVELLHEKTCLQGFHPGLKQTRLNSHRKWLEEVDGLYYLCSENIGADQEQVFSLYGSVSF